VGEGTTSERCHGCGIEVKGAMQRRPGRLGGVSMALAEEVEGDDGLRDEKVPLVCRVSRISAGEDGKEVILKRSDCPLGGVSTVDVGWDQLKSVSVCRDGLLIRLAGFIIKYVHIQCLVSLAQGVDNGLVGRNSVCVRLGDERASDNGISRRVIANHDVLVTAASSDGEAASVVGEEASGWDGQEFQSVGIGAGWDCGVIRVEAWFGQTDMLALLGHVSSAGFVSIGAITCGESGSEARPCAVVALFDGVDPSRFDRIAGGGVQVGNKGAAAGEVVGPAVGAHIGGEGWEGRSRGRDGVMVTEAWAGGGLRDDPIGVVCEGCKGRPRCPVGR
jgi:hypothetical protein